MYEAVIFDMDGLMFDTEPIWARSWAPVLEMHGLCMRPELLTAALGSGKGELPSVVERVFGPRADAVQIVDEHYKLAYELLAGKVLAKPGLFELVAWLEARGIARAVASSSPRHMIDHHLSQHGLADKFACVVDGGQVTRSKPASDIFLRAADELGVAPRDVLVLEDSANGIRAAHGGGFDCIMVPDMQEPTTELASLVIGVYHDLLEVRDVLAAI